MQTFGVTLNSLQPICKRRFDSLAIRLNLFAFIGEPFELLVAIVQLFQKRLDGFLATP
jgi:hypothetical protein